MNLRAPARLAAPLALAVLFAALFAGQALLRAHVLHERLDTLTTIEAALTRWLLYAVLSPLVAALARRAPLDPHRLATRVALHIAATAAFALTHSFLQACVYVGFRWTPPGAGLGDAFPRLALQFFGVNVVVFAAISGVYHAQRYHADSLRRDSLAAELRSRLAEARLDALRAQLNPHFLFNTLNATSVLAMSGEHERVVRTLGSLGDLLRVALDSRLPQEIPLARELEVLEPFLDIQRLRLGDRLAIERDIDPDARGVRVPSMVLQPLVENAMQHGIAARPGPGRVTLRAHVDGQTLVLRVEDSGPGFAATPAPVPGANGIGLANTVARLEQLHGDAARLDRGNLPGGGAYVELRLPARTETDDAGGQA